MVDMKNVVVRYFIHPNTGKGVACVAAVNTPDGIRIGWSQCNPKDTFNRKAARNIAIQRALNPPKEPIKPATLRLKMYRPSDSAFQPPKVTTITVLNPVEALIELVESVAKRAFDPNKPAREEVDIQEPLSSDEMIEALACAEDIELGELPPGLSYTEHGKHIIDDATGKIVATRINDEYVPGSNMFPVED